MSGRNDVVHCIRRVRFFHRPQTLEREAYKSGNAAYTKYGVWLMIASDTTEKKPKPCISSC
nr:MAG TPA: hypothetical protein [Caudoviricetes sp.]DAP21686.1 MAG TPA: hypothetical protein [Caudoviricetes sp.]DAU63574.1 MAG TPA: hypothetical protein [Caudoviricetes sp.]DAX07091.1 MAG TPA: hypothetical protein [Bacteriophage sp.]DAZ30162.1 MAG TPA: hypothetical protein [Caudoviricetes sp.]